MGYKVLTGFSQGVWDLLTATGFSFGILVGGSDLGGLWCIVYGFGCGGWIYDFGVWVCSLNGAGSGALVALGFGNGQRRIQRSSVNLNEAT